MGLLNVIELSKPIGFWPTIIFGLESAVADYALALILITVIINLVKVPLDFVNRYSTKKSTRKQMEMKPEIDKINKKYAHDKNLLNQKTMEVYKAHNFNIMGTCVGMILYLAFTLIVFWSLFGSLNTISTYKIGDQFLTVRDAYYQAYDIDVKTDVENTATPEEGDYIAPLDQLKAKLEGKTDEEKAALQTLANENAHKAYEDSRTGFLWIQNIWLADTTVNPVMDYDSFISKSSLTAEQISQEEYDMIITPVKSSARNNNGYFILVILAVVLNYLSIYINELISKSRAKKRGIDLSITGGNNNNKIMSIVMPIIMGIFTFFYNAAFGLYLIAGALISVITSPLVTLFVDMLEFDAIKKERERTTAIYDRKRK